jgi:cytochrome c
VLRHIFGLTLAALAACSDPEPAPPPPSPRFSETLLDAAPGEPMGLAVLPDGRVLYTSREGSVWLNDGAGGRTLAARIPVYWEDEDGLQGIALDPRFAETGWVYLYYSPPLGTPLDDPATAEVDEALAPVTGSEADFATFAGHLQLSRFRFDGEQLDLASEQVILSVPVERGICCHIGGQIDFDANENLLLSTGDDSNPFQSSGYTPLDERPERNPAFDAQRSAGNTNDLRGKLLRIHVEADGSYTIPPGNLFAPGLAATRPEIYVMGLRNPFRFAADRQRGVVYLADYSPDARQPNPERGPAGTGKWVIIRGPANYGWPYCATDALPYVDFDFATGVSTAPFDCTRPLNQSPRNTGLVELPPVAAPEVYYSFDASARFPELGVGGVGPMAGPVYDGPGNLEGGRWPSELRGVPLFYEWSRDFVAGFHLDAAGNLERIESLAGEIAADNPIDMEFGPDGALFVLGYGDGFYSANPDARLTRVEAASPLSGAR